MQLSTNCPDCKTHFRITQEQLAVRQGLVRCGRCQTVFNGFGGLQRGNAEGLQNSEDALVSTAPSATIETPSDHAESSPPSALIIDDNNTFEHEEKPFVEATSVPIAPHENAFDALTGRIDTPPPSPSWTPQNDQTEHASDTDKQAVASAAPTLTVLAEDVPSASEAVPHENISADSITESVDETADTKSVGADESKIADIQTDPVLYPPDSFIRPRPKRGAVVLSLILIVLLAGQIIYLRRTEIAANWPNVKPYLTSFCGYVGCRVPLPQQIDQLAIETSEMQMDPTRPTVVLVTAILRNQSAVQQAYPILEVTLMDAQDRPIARRSLIASEYLDPPPKMDEGLAPNSEVITHTGVETVGIKAAGYRLRLFYR